jgi:hydrogenase maturation protease
MARVLVAGYGSPLRQDDGVGWLVASALAERWRGVPAVAVLVGVQPLPEWSAALAEADLAYFVDARPVRGGDPGGVVVSAVEPAGHGGLLDGHAAGPGALLALAAALYGRAPRARIVAVPARGFAVSDRPTEESADEVAQAIRLLDRLIAGHVAGRDGAPCA